MLGLSEEAASQATFEVMAFSCGCIAGCFGGDGVLLNIFGAGGGRADTSMLGLCEEFVADELGGAKDLSNSRESSVGRCGDLSRDCALEICGALVGDVNSEYPVFQFQLSLSISWGDAQVWTLLVARFQCTPD